MEDENIENDNIEDELIPIVKNSNVNVSLISQ